MMNDDDDNDIHILSVFCLFYNSLASFPIISTNADNCNSECFSFFFQYIARWIALIFLNILWIFKKFIRLCHVKLSTILLLFTICLKNNLK